MGAIAPLHIVVTGAAGYLGKAIVRAAEAHGHRVTPIVRSPGAGLVQDLARDGASANLIEQIKSADAIIHAASEMSGDWELHERSTLPATQTICYVANALNAHLVQISSIAIYDFAAIPIGGIVSEASPIEFHPAQRDGYVRAKLAQEVIVAAENPDASVLRIGAIYGPKRHMNAHLGIGLGPILLRLASRGQVPLAHVDMVAKIAVAAAQSKASGAVNVVDTDLPDRIRFISALSASGWPKLVIPLPWQALTAVGALLSFWKGRPGLLRKKVLHARMKPLAYDNALMRAQFGDTQMPAFEVLMKRAMQDD
ncbi:MAG: NAD(P)-dependent oxidoreductase [Planktotalea sp.]|uniref:NAD-dependent epimerase/dehydratase family protein n=1 Tax=Planktotalea sp. TaxID=2029877 RepID=UPI003C7753DD